MYDLDTIKETTKNVLKALTNSDSNPLLADVTRGWPDEIALFQQTLGHLVFANATEKQRGIEQSGSLLGPVKQTWQVSVDAGLVMFVPGQNEEADRVATNLADVIADTFKNQNLLNLPGVSVYPVTKSSSLNWFPINVNIGNIDVPEKCLTASYKFTITANNIQPPAETGAVKK